MNSDLIRKHIHRLLVALCMVGFTQSLWAFSLGVDPSHLDFKTKPGEAAVQQLWVINDSADKLQVALSVEEWTLRDDGSKLFVAPGETPNGCGAWITLEPSVLTLAGNEKKSVTVRLVTPASSQGGHQAVVFAQNLPDAKQNAGRVPFVGKVGALVLQETVGSSVPALEVKNIGLQVDLHSQSMTLFLRNVGNTFIRTTGSAMIIKENSGEVVQRIDLPKWQTLPGTLLKPTVTFKQPLPAGKYVMVMTVKSEGLDPVVLEDAFTL